ncbi:uncharacterized protein CTHT_0038020 [Thermochaetoides thermophila DSM 1495]|uniref:Spo7-like protein n=1 Tax=Chaetomium thermophilum (strain DSM 1495 / CBS 144.50 / IMI 039719) TaxID=759272 RepID=G0S894_CHATD|nr:hypothetical protein CTHT_0038020 [Thermochaetoides thermophila DSM 1495]EGS21928.1 hypothetical protein CTHT_0038020 [Thermochaetoides thermophila DSM 1495]
MTEAMADVDSIVKGAPVSLPPGDLSSGTASASGSDDERDNNTNLKGKSLLQHRPGDPLSHTPSSPSMIYLNLLILEASLRAQYLELRARRRHHTFFLSLLTAWTAFFGYALFLAPREDGRGVGGSVYWAVETAERMCFLAGIVTALLVWVTGIWERGIRWPRRWFAVSNRGLRGFNCKLVLLRQPWWKEALSTIGWFLTYGLFSDNGSSYRWVDPALVREVDREMNLDKDTHPAVNVGHWDAEKGGHEEDLAPGGDYVKLLLLAKPFSPTFRENWELYRAEYWEKENERRARLRAKLKERDRQLRKQKYGWLWWLPWRRIPDRPPATTQTSAVAEKAQHPRHAAVAAEHKRARSGSIRRGSMSRGTSGSAAAALLDGEKKGGSSTSSSASENKKRKKLGPGSKGRQRERGERERESRSATPEVPSPLSRESSVADAA